MTRRHVNEFRPDEALSLISADREGRALQCPCCGGVSFGRVPIRASTGQNPGGPVTLTCAGCGRLVSYMDRSRVMA